MTLANKKTITLNSKSSGKKTGEEITSIDEITDENNDKGEIISVFNEDESDLSGDVIKSFSFNSNSAEKSKIKDDIDPSSIIPIPAKKINGLTTPVNGEAFCIKRGYQFRPSTLKKLNELKANSDNINIYFNEIIDAAICYYYDAVFK